MPPVTLPRSEHPISRKDIDADALKVLYRLKSAGHIAYLVGGSVRDLMLGRRPKDFDISTSALPNEVKRLFRNCRLIGRRFRLAHIIFGRDKIVEVATFRRKSEEAPDQAGDLLVRRDNTFGSPEEDALRRDFTANGLFYDIATFSVIDWVGGLKDIEERSIRTIGDPTVRYREDPVRMLRAVKFASRLGFRICDEDLDAIRRHREDLLRASPERLRLELGRLLTGGHSLEAFELLDSCGLLDVVAPELLALRNEGRDADPGSEAGVFLGLRGLDRLVLERRARSAAELSQAVAFAALLAPLVLERPTSSTESGELVLRRGLGFAHGSTIEAEPEAMAEASAEEEESLPGDPIESAAEPVASAASASEPAAVAEPEPALADEQGAVDGEPEAEPVIDDEDRPAPEELNPTPVHRMRPSDLPVFAGGDPAARVESRIADFLLRFSVPRRDAQLIAQMLAVQPRMRRPGRRSSAHARLVRKEYFPGALLLLEAEALASGQGRGAIALWRGLAGSGAGAFAAEPRGFGDGRRRRRRRRNGRGPEEGATFPRRAAVAAPRPVEPRVEADLSEEELEARLRQKAEADQMRREQAFQSGRYLAPVHEGASRQRPIRARLDPASPLGSPIGVADPPGQPRRRRRRRRGGRGRGETDPA